MRPRPIEDPAAERFERLELATHGIAAAFACGGSLTTDRPLTLRFADGVRYVVQPGPDDTPWNASSLAPLIQRCDPAPFGRGRSTR